MKTRIINTILVLLLVFGISFATAQPATASHQETLDVAEWTDAIELANVSGRPEVIKAGNTYHMWYGETDTKLYHTSSTDPAGFESGTLTTYDTAPVECASVAVVYDSGTFYMIAYGTTDDEFAIYTSENGNSWTKKGTVFTGTDLPSYSKLDAPYLFKDGSIYKLYFQVKNPEGTSYSIYTAETSDALASMADGNDDADFSLANSNNAILSPGTSGTWDEKFVMHPMVVKEDDTYYMWYSAHDSVQPQQIGFASSTDGYNWVKSPGNPVISRDAYAAIGEPSVINDDGVWRMWFLATSNKIKYLTATGLFEFASIQAAINAASAGDTINVAAGTYDEGITTITIDLTINGATVSNTEINPTSNTGSSYTTGENGLGWFQISSGANVVFNNLVFNGTGKNIYSAIHFCADSGGGTVNDCEFTYISYPSCQGRGITNAGGTVSVTGCILDNIGRIGVFTRKIDTQDAITTITDCTYTGKGDVDGLDYAFEASGGGQITVEDCNVTNCTAIASSDGSTSAGILVTTYFGAGTQATITGCSIYNCSDGIAVGYDTSDTSVVIAHNNDLIDNTFGINATSYDGFPIPNVSIDATNNWWGYSSGPKHNTTNPNGLGNAVSDNVTYTPWLLVTKDDTDNEIVVPEANFGQQSETFTGTDTIINTTGTSGTGDITVTTALYSVPEDATHPLPVDAENERALKYIDVKIENSTYSGNVTVIMSYTEADLAAMGVKEDTLKLYYFKMSSGPWTLADNQIRDTDNNTVTGDIPASELTGTPLCIGGQATVTGQYEVGAPPAVTVTFTPTEMDPTVEQTVTVGVSVPAGENRTLAELTEVLCKVWYDADGGTPADTEFDNAAANTQICAVITWDGTSFSLDANGGDTTWSLGTCTAPTLTGTSGDFVLKFTPGKVAVETTGSAKWQIGATATSEYSSGFGYDAEATAMNWYGEMVLGSAVNVDWGSVPAGMDFDNTKAKQALGTTITYISNGDYTKLAKSSAAWTGNGYTAALNEAGTPESNAFSLMVYNADTLGSAKLLTAGGTQFDTGDITEETGNSESDNYLWLKLGTPFSQDTYSGSITFIIQPGAN